MATHLKRATVYFRPDIHQAIKLKAAVTDQSISDIVNDALIATLSEDEEDLAAFEERASEPNVSYEEFLAKLKADGKI
ncbi:MAG: CopG family transcriptional regulator [Pyrinomonadaceae bacterium]